jgi:dCMP deaminase
MNEDGANSKPSVDRVFLRRAYRLASLSTCKVRQVGAVIVKDNRAVAEGYNALCVAEEPCWCNCSDHSNSINRPLCPAVHAEQNALMDALNKGEQVKGTTLYCTTCPCILCARLLTRARIKRVVYCEEYMNEDGLDLLRESGIQADRLSVECKGL